MPRPRREPCAGGCGAKVPPPDTEDLEGEWKAQLLRFPRWCDACLARDQGETAARADAVDRRERALALGSRLRRSGLPRPAWELAFDPRSRLASVLAARRWTAGEGDRPGLILWGEVGVGKTHLAATALAELLRAGGRGLWTSGPVLMARLLAPFDSDDRERGLDVLLRPNLALVLDDLDKASSRSDWAKQQLFAAIDERVVHGSPLLVTTNLHPSDLAERLGDPFGAAIASRLAGHCATVEMGGPDRRTVRPAGDAT